MNPATISRIPARAADWFRGLEERARLAAAMAALHALLFAAAGLAGWGFRIPLGYYQLLDADALRFRLGESLFYLHAQPPLLNLGLGMALALEDWNGLRPETWLLAIHFLAGIAAAAAIGDLAGGLIGPGRRAWAAAAIIVAHPALYAWQRHYFYPFHEYVLLALAGAAALRWLERPRAARAAAFMLPLAALVYVRSLFHFAWGLASIAGLLAAAKDGPGTSSRRARAAMFALAASVLLAWPAKNALLFGFFDASSWRGYNLSQGLGLPFEEDPPPAPPPPDWAKVPALSRLVKKDGSANWNHYGIFGNFARLESRAREAIRREPVLLWNKILRGYWSFCRFTLRHPYKGFHGIDKETNLLGWAWARSYERVLYLDFREEWELRADNLRARGPHPPVRNWCPLMFAFPAVMGAGAVAAFRSGRRHPETAAAAGFMIAACLWTAAMVVLVDGTEGNRMRYSTEPYFILIAAWLIPAGRRKGPESGGPSAGEPGRARA